MLIAKNEGGTTMAVTVATRQELAHRSTDGIEVSLFWAKLSNRVTIELVDNRLDERLCFEVARDKALDAFRHPYAYAPARVPDGPAKTRKAVQT
jgi:hypothetical protein